MTEATLTRKQYSIMTFLLFWCGLIILSSMYMTIPLLTIFSKEFSITLEQSAWAGSAFSFCYAIGCLLFGPFSDQYGRKIFLFTSIFLLSFITIAISFVSQFYILVILRALQGLVAAAFAPLSLVYAGEMFPKEKRVTAIGFISLGLFMAGIIGQVYVGVFQKFTQWSYSFLLIGLIYLVTSYFVYRYLPDDFIPTSKTSSLKQAVRKMYQQIKERQLLFAFPITFSILFSLVGVYTMLGHYLSLQYGLQEQDILMIRAIGIVGMLISPFAGRIAARFGMLQTLRVGLLLSITSLLFMITQPNLILIIILTIFFVMGLSLVNPINISVINLIANKARGSALSFNAFILFLGASSSPIMAIFLLKNELYQLAFLLFSLFLFIGMLSSLFIKLPTSMNILNKKMKSS
ncbi:putative MFS transporter [Bacillus sp. TS-2]|nr:putative MFS transporter [Bacillus sp. TS-2]